MSRKSNFELIRIFAMVIIIAYHLVPDVKTDIWLEGSYTNKMISSMFLVCGYIGVQLFYMLTGYFMCDNDKIRLKKIVTIGVFYSFLTEIIYFIARFGFGFSFPQLDYTPFIFSAVLKPVTSGSWWYLTSYFYLMIFHPIINSMTRRVNKKGFQIVLIFMFISDYFLAARFIQTDYMHLERTVFCYLLGVYVKKYIEIELLSAPSRIATLVIYIASWICAGLGLFYVGEHRVAAINSFKMQIFHRFIDGMSYCLFGTICSLAVFLLVKSVDIGCNRIINTIANTTFGIYLFHASPVISGLDIYKKYDAYLGELFVIKYLLWIIITFVGCGLLDIFRQKIFEPFMNSLYDCIAVKFSKYIVK